MAGQGGTGGSRGEGQVASPLVSMVSVVFPSSYYKASWQIPDPGICALGDLLGPAMNRGYSPGNVSGHWCQLDLYPWINPGLDPAC